MCRFDEHPWIEQFGATASYRRLREGIRRRYRENYPLTHNALRWRALNPGAAMVSKLSAEPRVAVQVIEELLAPWRATGRLRVLLEARPVAMDVDGDRIGAVTLATRDGVRTVVSADYVIDATETGELLPLANVEHVTGFEASSDTGEPSAPAQAQPLNMQAVTVCFAFDHREGENHVIDRPEDYHLWREYAPPYWPGRQLGWVAPHPHTLSPHQHEFTPNPSGDPTMIVADQSKNPGSTNLWTFRRLLARNVFQPGFLDSDVVLANWPMIDYVEGPVFGVSDDEAARHVEGARRQSRSMLYWMQTEAPRPDGGTGFPGLRLRPDVLDTSDGFAKYPYIRESRRIRARRTVVEQDISLAVRGDKGAVSYPDSVGVGMYRIDLHPSTGGDNYIDVGSSPYQIPLGALLPVRVRNLFAGAKNVGTTHITNGAYRLHPAEWNIGEAAGALAAWCIEHGVDAQTVHDDAAELGRFQHRLDHDGVERSWPTIGGY